VFRTVPKGYSVETFTPGMPGESYSPFTQDVKHELAAGLGVSYMSLTGDLKGTSFSSGRMGLGPERRRWRRKQEQMRDAFHTPLFRAWLRYASLSGALALTPAELAQVQAAAVWLLPGWDYVDPTKDADAHLTEVANTMNSRTAILAAKGRDFKTVARQVARERRFLKSLGLPEDTTLTPPAPDAAPAPETPADV
jgi:lambda family phage portal protein